MNPRQQSMLIGALVGAALGAVGGYLFTRNLDDTPERGETLAVATRSVSAGDVVKLIIAVMAVLRGVAELGDRD
jgi:NhaP-type Na+/H+ or K+/H+ antiporter